MTEIMSTGYGNEPLETPGIENGHVIDDQDYLVSQDELFAAADRLVDLGVANMGDARKMVGYEPEPNERTETDDALFNLLEQTSPVQGVSVKLGERATAVASLLDGIAAQNKLSGALESGAVQQRYRNGAKVISGMRKKAANFKASQAIALETLAKTHDLKRAGFNDAEIYAARVGVQGEFSRFTGKGREVNARRQKEKRMVARTDRRSRGEKR